MEIEWNFTEGVLYNFQFQYTNSDRTHDSYQAFIEGLFENGAYNVHADVLPRDELLEV